MYFITKKSSVTGKKIQLVMDRANKCLAAQKKLAKEFGFKEWREAYWRFVGGISAVTFKTPPDSKIWKQVVGNPKGEYFPKQNSKEGKAIYEKIAALPTVGIDDINQCVNAGEIYPSHVGISSNDTHWCIISDEKWQIDFPKDCQEITTTKKIELFGK